MTIRSQNATTRFARAVTAGLVLALAHAAGVAAQTVVGAPAGSAAPAGQAGTAEPGAAKAAREHELESLRAEQQRAAETEARLRREVESIGEDRRKLAEALIATAARLRGVEERISGAETRLRSLEDKERTVRKSLYARRGAIIEVLAALQRIGRRPPPAIMVAPEDALQAVHTAMLLGAVLPQMRAEAQALTTDLSELVGLRQRIAKERDDLAISFSALTLERQRMSLLIDERQRKQAEAETALEAERQRAATLARQTENLRDLIAKLERDGGSVARAAEAARADDNKAQSGNEKTTLAALKDPGRLSPAVAFAATRGALPLPVSGVRIRDFGTPDGLGGSEKGLWIASRPAAQVTAPCDGWVVYAGPFRSYGQLLILNAGGGYHVLLAGMERISVDLGQFVLTGEPAAVMGSGPQSAAAIALGSSQPVLYVEFRKDGTPVDPNPWWATTDSEKVRG
jgi:septal ring factor EnvC (AmiA/AmiB activator)